MSEQNMLKALKALANENRLKILEAIKSSRLPEGFSPEDIGLVDLKDESACCVEDIVDKLAMAQSSVSQHLKELHNAGLLQRHKKAQWVYYTIDDDTMDELVDYLNQFTPRV